MERPWRSTLLQTIQRIPTQRLGQIVSEPPPVSLLQSLSYFSLSLSTTIPPCWLKNAQVLFSILNTKLFLEGRQVLCIIQLVLTKISDLPWRECGWFVGQLSERHRSVSCNSRSLTALCTIGPSLKSRRHPNVWHVGSLQLQDTLHPLQNKQTRPCLCVWTHFLLLPLLVLVPGSFSKGCVVGCLLSHDVALSGTGRGCTIKPLNKGHNRKNLSIKDTLYNYTQ